MLAITTAFGEADMTATMPHYFSKTRTISAFLFGYDTLLGTLRH